MLQRTLSILIAAPLFLLIVYWPGGYLFTGLVAAMALIALREFYSGCRRMGADPANGFGYVAALLFLGSSVPLLDPPGVLSAPWLLPGPRSACFFFFGLTLLVATSLAAELGRPNRAPIKNLGPTWLGAVYIGWLFPFAARLRWLSVPDLLRVGYPVPPQPGWMLHLEPGFWIVLFVLLLTWSVDTLAYLTGKAIGRHKMAPVLSPGKTWEGAAGGFLGAILMGAAAGAWMRFPLDWSIAAGALVGIVAQIGDLCKSAMKREIGIKDFGAILPGHGGVLDRFDSFLFTAPAIYFLWLLWPTR